MYEALDLFFTSFGDCDIANGDLGDTEADPYRSLRQEIATIVCASMNDWMVNPDIGANLSELIGSPNNQETAAAVASQISAALSKDLLNSGDFKVDTVPLSANSLGVMVAVNIGAGTEEVTALTIPLIFNLGLGIFTA